MKVGRCTMTIKPRNLEKPEQSIIEWFKDCDLNGIYPWEYDLKEEIFMEVPKDDSAVKRLLSAWAGRYFSQKYNRKESGSWFDVETEDCDLMQCIYWVLWGHHSKYAIVDPEFIDADIMNSFWTPYKKALKKGKLQPWIARDKSRASYQKNEGDMNELLFHFSEEDYKKVNDNFETFAKLTHTIGNCTLVPETFNGSVHNDNKNTWYEALDILKDSELQVTALIESEANVDDFDSYKEKYFMSDTPVRYADKDHPDKDYLDKVTPLIEARGKKMTEMLCKKLMEENAILETDLAKFKFYSVLKK